MERGAPTWHTSSTCPMSMPSSREAVATTTGASAALSFCSASSRVLRDRLPWWASTLPSPSRSVSWCDTRSTSRRVCTNTRVVRWVRICSVMRS